MKIICTKEEQARLVRQCYRQMCCRGCALYGVCDGENSIAAFVEDSPAVDAVEVVHARWVDRYGGKFENPIYVCSACGEKALYKLERDCLGGWHDVQALTPVCPNCGAKMDGD